MGSHVMCPAWPIWPGLLWIFDFWLKPWDRFAYSVLLFGYGCQQHGNGVGFEQHGQAGSDMTPFQSALLSPFGRTSAWPSAASSVALLGRRLGMHHVMLRATGASWFLKSGMNHVPIGSMYGIYTNIGLLMVNVTVYSIHGSYGVWNILKYQVLFQVFPRSKALSFAHRHHPATSQAPHWRGSECLRPKVAAEP